ncbi:MAG: hypothetical protein JW904_02220 [Spirochaetales bacterium]|nr:hypothetical protein [Spirochaetales bacterium]
MRKGIIFFLICLTVAFPLFSDIGVDREELKKAKDIEFTNYTGPYDRIDTFEEIRGIGVQLGRNISKASTRTTYFGLYSIIHVYTPDDTSGKLDADIFVIESGAGIDHIRNVRTVIAGYLQEAYGYTYDDAFLLARFITLYNAVFRGNVAYFSEAYKSAVMKYLSSSDAGLATVWSEWPGKTKMLIPLSEGFEKGKLSSLDTGELTEEEVKDTLRREKDKGIDDRKDMVDLQEKQLEEKEKDLQKDKQDLAEDKQKLEEDKKQLDETKKTDGTTTDSKKQEEDIAKREDEIKKQEEDIAKREDTIKKDEDNLQKDRDEIARDERTVEEERKTTATDSTTSLQTTETVVTEKGIFLKVQDGAENDRGELYLYNFKDDALESRSENVYIKNRRVLMYNNFLLAIAEPAGSDISYLMLINAKTLTVDKQSETEIYNGAILTTQGSAVYTVVKKGSSYFIGKFDNTLAMTHQSGQEVNPNTAIVIQGSFLYVQTRSGEILRLNITDLKTQDTATVN